MMHLNRRKFILASAAAIPLAGATAMTLSSALLSSPQHFIRGVGPELYDTALGKIFMETVLRGIDSSQIFHNLRAKFGVLEQWFGFASSLRAQAKEDYRTGRVMEVNGWLMPETAVHLSALAYLVQPDVR